MAALPPSRHERRARPGSLASPVNSRMYRGTWLLVGIPLLIAAFTVYRPEPLREPELQPEFDGASAALSAEAVREAVPDSHAGLSDGARRHELGRGATAAVRPPDRNRPFSRENPRPRRRRARKHPRTPRRTLESDHRGRRAPRQFRRESGRERQCLWNGRPDRARTARSPRPGLLRSRPHRTTRSSSCRPTAARSAGWEQRISRRSTSSASGWSRPSTWTRSAVEARRISCSTATHRALHRRSSCERPPLASSSRREPSRRGQAPWLSSSISASR